MHATNLGAQPPFTYMVQESYDAMAIVHQCREAYLVTLRWMQVQMLKFLLKRKQASCY